MSGFHYSDMFLSNTLPKYQGITYWIVPVHERAEYRVTAIKNDWHDQDQVEFTIKKEQVYNDDLVKAIEEGLEPLVRPDPPLQVDLSIKEYEL